MKRRRHLLRIALVWLGVSIAIGGVTLGACGSFQPILYGTGYPDYSPAQWILFVIARAYCWPVTIILTGLAAIAPFDIFVSPFSLEFADVKLGPGVIVLYALFYSLITVLARRIISRACVGKKQRGLDRPA